MHRAILRGEGAGLAAAAVALAAFAVALGPSSARAEPPGFATTRHLSMGNSSRASASGASAAIINPAGMSLLPKFAIAPAYQVRVENKTHGGGITAMDSLNNPRLSIGLSYAFMYGQPQVVYRDADGLEQQLKLRHVGHEAGLSIGVVAVPGWLLVGLRPKYQYTSLRFDGPDDETIDAHEPHSAFGLDASVQLLIGGWVSIAAIGSNLVGTHPSAYSAVRELELAPYTVADGSLDRSNVPRLSDYPRTFTHALAVFPTRDPGFSINLDGSYDFTTYWGEDTDGDGSEDNWTRIVLGSGAEYTIGPVPLRIGGYWDRRGPAADDDRGYLSAGLGFVRTAEQSGSVGVDVGIGFSRQIAGPHKETFIGAHITLLLHPKL